jgi:hypothetical protein
MRINCVYSSDIKMCNKSKREHESNDFVIVVVVQN